MDFSIFDSSRFAGRVRAFVAAEDGAALAEYAVVLATLSVLMITVLAAIAGGAGRNLNTTQSGMTAWGQST